MNESELIDRLTRTYTALDTGRKVTVPAVGELPPTAVVRTLPTRRDRRPMIYGIGALVAAAVLLGVFVVVPRGTARADSAAHLATKVRHATLGVVPEGFGLVSIETSEDGDALRFSDGTRELRVITARRDDDTVDLVDVAGPPVRGHPASLVVQTAADSPSEWVGTSLSWIERPGIQVRLFGTGTWSENELVVVAEKVMMVSDKAWAKLITNNGFTPMDSFTDDRAVFDRSFPGIAEKHLDRSLDGSLQTGVGMRIGCCEGHIGSEPRNSVLLRDAALYLVMTTPAVDSVRISLNDKVLATVKPVADPGIPTVKYASVALPETLRQQGAKADFLDVTGSTIETNLLQ